MSRLCYPKCVDQISDGFLPRCPENECCETVECVKDIYHSPLEMSSIVTSFIHEHSATIISYRWRLQHYLPTLNSAIYCLICTSDLNTQSFLFRLKSESRICKADACKVKWVACMKRDINASDWGKLLSFWLKIHYLLSEKAVFKPVVFPDCLFIASNTL